jgi:prophage maintenance system killer protein
LTVVLNKREISFEILPASKAPLIDLDSMPIYDEEADIALQAAVLAHGIAEGQPFLDGNKRIAYLACKAFLRKNGYRFTIAEEVIAGWILQLSTGRGADWLAIQLRDAIAPIEP